MSLIIMVFLYSSYYISGFLEDFEGNIWLTTLGKGILLIKNDKVISYKNHKLLRHENCIKSKYAPDGTIFLGTENGKVFKIDTKGDVQEVFSNGSMKITLIDFYKNYLLSNSSQHIEIVDMEKDIATTCFNAGAIKESQRVGENEVYLASSIGVHHLQIQDNLTAKRLARYGESSWCNSVFYDSLHQDLYIASVKGLFKFHQDQQDELRRNETKLISTSLTGYDQTLYAATATNGIVVFNKGHLIDEINTKTGLLSNRIIKIKLHNQKLFISTAEGLQIYNTKTKAFIQPEIINTVNGSRILDFDFYDNELFLITNKDLQKIKLEDLKQKETPPEIKLKNVIVNDHKRSFNTTNTFTYSDNKFEFEFQAISHGHANKLKYLYRIKEVDFDWEITSFGNNHVKYASLPPGKYTFEVKAINEDGVESETIQYTFEIKKPFWDTWWFYLVLTLFITSAVLLIWQLQLKRIKRKNAQEKELIASKLTALKLQMNPHFIFNALNSIQDLILKEDTENSYDYIVKFSNLVRMTLNYSDKDLISLEEEIEMLQLYLELEDLRFKRDFSFEIKNLVSDEVKIPSMLIQPFVENSIKHGLLHKIGPKSIKIHFKLDDILTCTIEDNGVGIEKSTKINQRKGSNHDSLSIKIIKKRIDILKQYYTADLGIEFINLYHQDDSPSGTKVIIKIPYENI